MKKLLAIALLALAAGWCSAQTGTSMLLTVNANASGTATIMRAPGTCPASGLPSSGTTLSSSVAVTGSGTNNTGTYTDTTVTPGSSYCYWATLQAQGGGSGVSNTFLGSISVTVTLSGKPQ